MTPSTSLEDLIAENLATNHAELLGARRVPRDGAATSDFKGDPANLTKLAGLAQVPAERIADVAVRGTNVTFQVEDADGALSAGFFPLAALEDQDAASAGAVTSRTPIDPAPQGGTATVPSVVQEPGEPTDEGVPNNLDQLTGDKVAGLLKDTPDGIDPAAVVAHEFARPTGPRTSVVRAAKAQGLLDDEGNPKG